MPIHQPQAPATTQPVNSQQSLLVWIVPEQAALLEEIRTHLDPRLAITAVGTSSHIPGQASALGLPLATDLRVALITGPYQAILILGAPDFGAQPEDVAAIVAASGRGVAVLTTQPIPASMASFVRHWSGLKEHDSSMPSVASSLGATAAVRPLGLFARSQQVRNASELLGAFGEVRSGSIRAFGLLGRPLLGTLLVNAFDLLFTLIGGTEDAIDWIDAHLTAPHAPPKVPISLSAARGSLAALVRCGTNRAMLIEANDHAARAGFEATLYGPQGRLQLGSQGAAWFAPDGSARAAEEAVPASPARLIAGEVAATLLHAGSGAGPMLLARSLIAAETSLLSAHTGHPESPATIRGLAHAS